MYSELLALVLENYVKTDLLIDKEFQELYNIIVGKTIILNKKNKNLVQQKKGINNG
ncbi:hypothetical protein ['Camptotheca acuminata' phytoplasma]|uniref:hypothetical protein n=1 Tax='Camptotheca acuminata' phytoplasma TaxID=3239192 RepID=UPI00351A0C8D